MKILGTASLGSIFTGSFKKKECIVLFKVFDFYCRTGIL